MSNAHWRFTAASFSPAQVKMMTSAFEKAWQERAGNLDADHVPRARDHLAITIIELASGWPHDVESLARAAISETQKKDGVYQPPGARPGQPQRARS